MTLDVFFRRGLSLLLLLLLLFSCSGSGNGSGNQVLWFSDIHFDPFADPTLVPELAAQDQGQWDLIFARSDVHGTYPSAGQETNSKLLHESLRDMRRNIASPDFILFTGDFLAHHFNENYASLTGDSSQAGLWSFIDKTLAYLVARVIEYYPQTPVFFCLGNNDSYEGDYLITRNSPFLDASARIFDPLLKSEANRTSLATTYLQGGQYEMVLPQANARLLALNAIFFSPHAPDSSIGPAGEQLDWLESRLSAAARDQARVWILLHTPPGVDVFATRRVNPDPASVQTVVPLNREDHLARLRQILVRHQAQVGALFAGHIHRDDFRLIRSEQGAVAVTFVVPAISPVYADNPAYKILSYDPASLVVQDYAVRYLDSGAGTWQTGQIFSQSYGPGELSPARMEQLWGDLLNMPRMRDQYAMAYAGFRTPVEVTEQSFPYYWTAIAALDSNSYRQKIRQTFSKPRSANQTAPLAAHQYPLQLQPNSSLSLSQGWWLYGATSLDAPLWFVGMAEVSSNEITVYEGQHVQKGEQLGLFHFAGSSCKR
jgi:sphingomyelin phosphodiesterase acid-like 3